MVAPDVWIRCHRVRIFWDGASGSAGAGCGILAQGAAPPNYEWENIWISAIPLHQRHTAMATEMIGLYEAVLGLCFLSMYDKIDFRDGRVNVQGRLDVSAVLGHTLGGEPLCMPPLNPCVFVDLGPTLSVCDAH